MQKLKTIIAIVAVLTVAMLCIGAVSAVADDAVSPGPAPDSNDGIPSGNQYIQPETPGVGPAPNSGDGVSDGSGF